MFGKIKDGAIWKNVFLLDGTVGAYKLTSIIIWQTQSLRSHWFFLGQDFAVRTVSMETVQFVYFCFGAKPANSTFATKTAKTKCENCHSSHWNYQQKQKRLNFFRNFERWMKNRRRRTFFKYKSPEVHFTYLFIYLFIYLRCLYRQSNSATLV